MLVIVILLIVGALLYFRGGVGDRDTGVDVNIEAPAGGGGELESGGGVPLSRTGEEDIGVASEPGVETSLTVLEPRVAAIDGEDGGSGERVK